MSKRHVTKKKMKGYKWEQSSWNLDLFQDLSTNSDNICIETCCLACHCNSNNKQRRRYYDVKEYIDNVTKKNPHNSRNHNIFDTKSYSLVDLHQSKILKNIINDSNLIKNSGYTTNLKPKTLLTKAKFTSTKEIFEDLSMLNLRPYSNRTIDKI